MVEKMPTEELKIKLIDTLRTVTAGKVYFFVIISTPYVFRFM